MVPFTGGDRFRVASWIRQRLEALHPSWPLLVGIDGGEPWTKARAVNRAIPGRGDVLVICDADVAVPAKALEWAVAAVLDGAAWAVPFGRVHRLTPEATTQILADRPDVEIAHMTAKECIPNRPPYDAVAGGGIFAVARDAWETVGGFDERFAGQEDVPLAHALDTLAGPYEQLPAPLIHLFHPNRRVTRQLYQDQALEARYLAARGKPAAMLALIRERTAAGAVDVKRA